MLIFLNFVVKVYLYLLINDSIWSLGSFLLILNREHKFHSLSSQISYSCFFWAQYLRNTFKGISWMNWFYFCEHESTVRMCFGCVHLLWRWLRLQRSSVMGLGLKSEEHYWASMSADASAWALEKLWWLRLCNSDGISLSIYLFSGNSHVCIEIFVLILIRGWYLDSDAITPHRHLHRNIGVWWENTHARQQVVGSSR